MDNLNLEKFNPTRGELLALADEARKLSIAGIDDKTGYDLVHQKRMELKAARVKIAKTGKEAREDAVAYQKKVLAYEKELIGIIEPVEEELEAKQKAIDEAIEMEKRKAKLPERLKRLEEFGAPEYWKEELILAMDDTDFEKWFNDRKSEFLEYKEKCIREQQVEAAAKLRIAQEKLDSERRALEESKRIEDAKREAEKNAQEKALRDAELAKVRAEEEKAAAVQAEKNRQAQKEKAKADAEAARVAKEKAEQEALEKKKKYQNFLEKYEYVEGTTFRIEKLGNKIVLYKKVGEMTV